MTNCTADRINPQVSRRGFLGALGATGAGLASIVALSAQEAQADTPNGQKGILFDSSKCVGCHYCEAACKKQNGLSCEVKLDLKALPDDYVPHGMLSSDVLFDKNRPKPITEDDRDGNRYLRVVQYTTGIGENKVEFNMRRACTHCGLCASVCPSGALKQGKDGLVDLNRERCIGCGYCYQACPFDIPRYPEKGDRAMAKCNGCASRVAEGLEPACVAICPTGALAFGDRASVAASGNKRVDELLKQVSSGDESAKSYHDVHLYGKDQLGGLGVMTVATESDKSSGLPDVPNHK